MQNNNIGMVDNKEDDVVEVVILTPSEKAPITANEFASGVQRDVEQLSTEAKAAATSFLSMFNAAVERGTAELQTIAKSALDTTLKAMATETVAWQLIDANGEDEYTEPSVDEALRAVLFRLG